MLTVVDLFSCFSTSMINLAIHDDSNGYSNEASSTTERWPPYRSYDGIIYDVITDHKSIYSNNYSQNRDRAMGEVSLCVSRQDASNDMEYCLPGSFIRLGHLTWPMFKFSNWPFRVKIYIFRCALTRKIRWCFAFSLSFLVQKLFSKNFSFQKKTTFFVWPALERSKCDLR